MNIKKYCFQIIRVYTLVFDSPIEDGTDDAVAMAFNGAADWVN
jgi:hypothetical protein